MLDVGCALGDAIPVWRKKYPDAKLYGCDVCETAIERCQHEYGHIAKFFRASFEEITGFYDVIYCSNVLEHFEGYIEIAEHLLSLCRILYVMVPFNELREGKPLCPAPGKYHVTTFYTNSFDKLLERGKASRIETKIFSCPGAWGLTRLQRFILLLGGLMRNRPIFQEPLQILFTIYSSAYEPPKEGHI